MNIIDSGYGIVTKHVMLSSISIQSKGVYAYLSSYAGQGSEAFPSVSRMIKELNIARASIIKYLKELEDSGFIRKEKLKDDPFNHSNKYVLIYTIEGSNSELTEGSNSELTEGSNSELSPIKNNVKTIINKKDTCQPVIDYLNEVTKKKFQPRNESAILQLWHRIKETSIDDCKKVLDYLAKNWLKDDKMKGYLDYTTPFRKSNFYKYLDKADNVKNVKNKDEFAEALGL